MNYSICYYGCDCGICVGPDEANTLLQSLAVYDEDYQLGLATILKDVIHEAEGIELTACDDSECRKYLVYQPLYPWRMSDADKAVTAQSLRQVFERYVKILTDKPVEVDYQSVENGG